MLRRSHHSIDLHSGPFATNIVPFSLRLLLLSCVGYWWMLMEVFVCKEIWLFLLGCDVWHRLICLSCRLAQIELSSLLFIVLFLLLRWLNICFKFTCRKPLLRWLLLRFNCLNWRVFLAQCQPTEICSKRLIPWLLPLLRLFLLLCTHSMMLSLQFPWRSLLCLQSTGFFDDARQSCGTRLGRVLGLVLTPNVLV